MWSNKSVILWPRYQSEMAKSKFLYILSSLLMKETSSLCQQKKEKAFWQPARPVNHYTFSMCLNRTRWRDRLQFLCTACVCVCACVCVLCINRTCGSTYHGPFIWGISLPAFARHTLVGSSRGWVPRPSHLCVHVCVCVCVSLGLNIFDISKNPSRIWTSNIVRPDLWPPAFTVEQVSNTCFKASLCCCSHWRAWVGSPLHMVQPYGSSQTHSTINTHWNIPSATDMTNTRNLAIKMREYWTWFCISLYSQYCLVTCSI